MAANASDTVHAAYCLVKVSRRTRSICLLEVCFVSSCKHRNAAKILQSDNTSQDVSAQCTILGKLLQKAALQLTKISTQVADACSKCMCLEPRDCLSKGIFCSLALLRVRRVPSDGPAMCGSRVKFALCRLLLLFKNSLNLLAEVLRDHLILQKLCVLDQELPSFTEHGSIVHKTN